MTRDLDLFFHEQAQLGAVPDEVAQRLRSAGLEVAGLQSSEAFRSLRVTDGDESVVVDLVADPVEVIEPPTLVEWRTVSILADTAHEILVNKLCSLVHRSELRDLADVRALLSDGGDLETALGNAPRKDGGFSPLTLCWVLRDLAIEPMAELAGWGSDQTRELTSFRDELVARVMDLARPD